MQSKTSPQWSMPNQAVKELYRVLTSAGITVEQLNAKTGLGAYQQGGTATLTEPVLFEIMGMVQELIVSGRKLYGELLHIEQYYHSVGQSLFMTSGTLREALSSMFEVKPVLISCDQFLLEECDPKIVTLVFIPEYETPVFFEAHETLLATLAMQIRQYTRSEALPFAVGFKHSATTQLSLYQQFFLSEPKFDQSRYSLSFPRELFDRDFGWHNQHVQNSFSPASHYELAASLTQDSLSKQVASILSQADSLQKITVEQIGRQLGRSRWTLNRRLNEEGSSFQSLLQDERKKRAKSLLQNLHLSLEEIAITLGYSSSYSFTRAFKSWTGLCPSTFRQAVR